MMNKIKLFLQDLENEQLKADLIQDLPLMLPKIESLFQKIKESNLFEDATNYFNELQEIDEVLAVLFFKYDVPLGKELRKFVRDCDRLDDPWLREYLFKEIKNGKYSLSNEE